MAVHATRLALLTGAQQIGVNDSSVTTEGAARRFEFVAQDAEGIVLIAGSEAELEDDDSLRWDVATLVSWEITLETGEEVWAKSESGEIHIDRIVSGR